MVSRQSRQRENTNHDSTQVHDMFRNQWIIECAQSIELLAVSSESVRRRGWKRMLRADCEIGFCPKAESSH
jgi:hypothetical protein